MHSTPARAALGLALLLLLCACSPTPGAGALKNQPPAVSITPTPTPTPTPSPDPTPIVPLAPLPGVTELGLSEPAMSVQLDAPWVADSAGYTVAEVSPWHPGAVDVVRSAWSGEELWRQSVKRPDATSEPWLSTDKGLGLVSVWFSPDTDDRDFLDTARTVVGDITWFHQGTGERGGVFSTSEVDGGLVKARSITVGFDFYEATDGTVADEPTWLRYLGPDLTVTEHTHTEGIDPYQTWNGRLVARLDRPEPGALITLGQYMLLEFETGGGYSWFATDHFLHITSTFGDVVTFTPDGVLTHAKEDCAVAEYPKIATSRDQAAAGALLVSVRAGESQCVEGMPEGFRISAIGPDGWLLAEPSEEETQSPSEVWIGQHGGQEWRRTELTDSPLFTDEHVIFTKRSGDSLIVTAYAVADFNPDP